MSAIFPVLLVLIFLGCLGMLLNEGMWSNAIRLVNAVTAALVATNFWEPVAKLLDDQAPSYTYYWDFLALWGLFCVSLVVFQLATGFVSRVKVRFLKVVDRAGGIVFGALASWVMVCFVVFTLHTAPLAERFLWGGFDADSRMLMGLGPDRMWLGFMARQSRGTYCRYEDGDRLREFDGSQFLSTYTSRRAALQRHVEEKSATRVESGPKR
jgi:hypothetical protein